MKIKFLNTTTVELVYEAFIDAFFDYAVDIQMPIEDYIEMMITRDLSLDYSVGCFENEKLVSFVVCGYREITGKKYCYDGGTGTIKEYRRQGIGNQLVDKLIKVLRNLGIDYFVLEVLENNQPAIELYLKNGFEVTRKLECFEADKQEFLSAVDNQFNIQTNIDIYKELDCSKFLTFEPSWQNTKQSVLNSLDKFELVSLLDNNETIGYGIIHRKSGKIAQLGVLETWRGNIVESVLLHEMAKKTASNKLIFLNIEENNYLSTKLKELGFTNSVNQFEMQIKL